MHFQLPTTTALLLTLLPSIIAADQVPLKDKAAGWFDKAKQYIPSGVPPNPIDAGAAKVAESKVEKINIRNFERKLGPKLEGEEEWMIYLTGGNKSCFGRCGQADLAWNQSVPLLAALPKVPNSNLHLGTINCEIEEVLCTGLAIAVPAVHHFIFPQKTATHQPLSPMHEIYLNTTDVSAAEIVSIPRASKSRYLEYPEYTGALHPFDGWMAKYGLITPLGYFLWGFGSTPSWLIMIGISFFSRQYMAGRAARRPGIDSATPAAAPAPRAPAGVKKRN